ncbi:hypothetical protein ACWEQ8_40330 [Streptomyces noursei]
MKINTGHGTYAAEYSTESGGNTIVPVVGWDEEGYPLVLDERAGRLKRAKDVERYLTVYHTGPEATVIGLMPAAPGWRVVRRLSDGTIHAEHIAGWLVHSSGYAQPMVGELGGTLIEGTERRGSLTCAPGEDPETLLTDQARASAG